MAVLADSDLLEWRMVAEANNQVSYNVSHFLVVNTVGNPTDLDAVAAVSSNVGGLVKGLMAIEATFLGIDLRRIQPSPTSPVNDVVSAGVGVDTGGLLPTQVCGLFKKTSTIGGPAGRGRLYIPFPAEDSSGLDGRPIAAYVTSAKVLAELFTVDVPVDDLGGNSCNLVNVVLHKDTIPMSSHAIIQVTVRTRWATQRRRGAFGSPNLPPF